MTLKLFSQIHRSMIGQMLILSLLFITATIYFIAIQPLGDVEIKAPDPMYFTVEKIRRELRDFIDTKFEGKSNSENFKFSDELKGFLTLNPDFRYYMTIGDKVYSSGQPPKFYHQMQLDELDGINNKFDNAPLCSYFYKDITNGDDHGYVQYNYCNNQHFYLEFYGVVNPEVPVSDTVFGYYKRMVVGASGNLIIAAAGVFSITALILLFNWRLMNKLARVAYSFDPKNLNQKLPEKGLPNEVLPLIQAVNEMLSRIDITQKQHNFFLSTAAHEMRTPLTVLRTRIEMLDDSPLKDKLIVDTRRLVSLVNQLLRLMRVGGPKSFDGEIDIVQCCQRVIRERAILAKNSDVELSFETEVMSYVVPGDAGLMEIAIANLIDNAVSFSIQDSTVLVSLDASGILSVRDYGIGIPPDKLQSLFVPFAKFPPNRNGHGLGLAIVKAIVQLHSATVDAENIIDGGAQFNIRFSPRLD
ncbi:HAMP domain-containing sensor histidine kinase [Shewanella sp.]|uniref:HAMP domain-containing sensor histidine kinase n=1 Tax=Shewanella sp. TaxID=50422 RepID=UPI003A978F0D